MTPSPITLAWLHAFASTCIGVVALLQLLAMNRLRKLSAMNFELAHLLTSLAESLQDGHKTQHEICKIQADLLKGARIIQTVNGGKHHDTH